MAEGNLKLQYEEIHRRAMDAIEHWDAMQAWTIYKEIEKFLKELPAEKKNALDQEVSVLRRNLLVVGFPALPQEMAENLFREHVLDFFRVDVDLKERLLTRYIFVGYGDKQEERKRLYVAILKNNEHLGQITIGEWINIFEQRFKFETRTRKTVAIFLTQTGEVASLEKSMQAILGKILAVYDEYLCREVLDDFDRSLMEEQPLQSHPSSMLGVGTMDRLPLLQALSKYENLGNQLITEERIKVKSQPEPVRPSLLYWIKYYRDELGVGHHDSVQRGQFLFRSENGKKLSVEERERVGLILKSVEENFPLAIDTEHQEIIFPTFQGVTIGDRKEPAAIPLNARIIKGPTFSGTTEDSQHVEKKFTPAAPNPNASGGLRIGRGTNFSSLKPVAPAEPGAVSFSTSHMFPAEKEAAGNQMSAPRAETSRAPQQTSQSAPRLVSQPESQPNPFHIHPVSLGKKK